jgi:hypothetical protein
LAACGAKAAQNASAAEPDQRGMCMPIRPSETFVDFGNRESSR